MEQTPFREAGVRIIQEWSDASLIHEWVERPVVWVRRMLGDRIFRTYDAHGRRSVLEAADHINL